MSSEAIGSSARMMSGCCTSARAIATRCCWPPESWSARWAASEAISNCSSADIASALSCSGQVCVNERHAGIVARRPIRTLVRTSSRPTRLNCWKIIADRARHCRSSLPRSAVTSMPSNWMRPCVRVTRRLMVRSKVDLPAPERPITPTKPPGEI
ncbi:hypothetical protein ACVWWK_003114 [Bradyrhizobium sp. LB9.1b]